MPNEEAKAISEDTKSMLEDHVKKGKARKFILICKGSAIQTLIVFKKGPFGPKIAKAKKDGFKGEAVCGVVEGKGINITFLLPGTAEVDGAMKTEGAIVEAEPCKISKLRQFFQEEGDLSFKPEFKIVTALGDLAGLDELQDEDDESVQSESDVSSEVEEQPDSSTVAVDPAQKQKLFEALNQLVPRIREAVAAAPDRREEILGQVAAIKEHLQNDRLADARQGILSCPPLIKEILEGAAAAPKSVGDPASSFKTRLAALVPQIKQAVGTTAGDEARLKVSNAGIFARKNDYVQANALLDEAVRMLASASVAQQPSADAASSVKPPVDWVTAKARWQEASETIDGQIAKLQSALRNSGTEELIEIAEFGLNGVTGNFKVPLMAAIRNVDGAATGDRTKVISSALKVIKGFQNHIDSDEGVLVVDENPFGVPVTIRETLGAALGQLASALESIR